MDLGGGFFATFSSLPVRLAWETLSDEEVAATIDDMTSGASDPLAA